MTRESHPDIQTMHTLQHAHLDHLDHLVAPYDPKTPLDAGLRTRVNRYWGDLAQLRADNVALEAKLERAVERMKAAEAERDTTVDSAREARNALIQLKQDVAREKEREERARALTERDRTETAEERKERLRHEADRADQFKRYWRAL
jgi:Skp family chaperone for outer membrane proteins